VRFIDGTPVELIEFSENPNSLFFTVDNVGDQPSLLIADRFDPDWRLSINGQEKELQNYQGMRQVDLEPGTNQLELWYWPKWLYLGTGITMLSGLAIISRKISSR